MQLNMTTDYALRAMCYLASENRRSSISTISDAMSIPKSYLPSIMKKLGDAGLASVERGVSGGWILARSAEEITFLDIVSVMENTIKLNRCLDTDEFCNRVEDPNDCPMHNHYLRIQYSLEDAFRSITLQMLVDEEMVVQTG